MDLRHHHALAAVVLIGWGCASHPFPPETGVLPESGSFSDDLDMEPLDEFVEPINAPEQTVFQKFGTQILIHDDTGEISKFFSVEAGRGEVVKGFLEKYAGILADQIFVEASADQQRFRDAKAVVPPASALQPISDWVVVRGDQEVIEQAQRFINVFLGSIPVIEIEVQIVEVTYSDTSDYGIANAVDSSGNPLPIVGTTDTGLTFQAFDQIFPLAGESNELASLTFSAIQDNLQFAGTLQALKAYENVSITSMPRTAVRNGGTASLVNADEHPIIQATAVQSGTGGVVTAAVAYKPVGTKLYVSAYLQGTDMVNLQVEAEVSVVTGSVSLGEFDSPVIATRTLRTDVPVRDGNRLVIGGLLAKREVEKTRKVPLLGDIPGLKYLFSGQLKSVEWTDVYFFITPRVLPAGGTPQVMSLSMDD